MQLNKLAYEQLLKGYHGTDILADLPGHLLDLWYEDYAQTYPKSELVLVRLEAEGSSFTYLFDINRQRVIGSVGLPSFVSHKRDASRMAGHPLANSKLYDRGHLLAHSLGGGADINLVPQLSKVNRVDFQKIERIARRLASENVRCVYFVRPIYPIESVSADEASQLPSWIEQGLVGETGNLTYELHGNT
jgi:hypothetical protein